MKLLLDEMLSGTIAQELRRIGHDVVAAVEHDDLRGLADPDLFEHAQQDQRVVATYNRDDFLALDRSCRDRGRDHRGIVILNPRRFPQSNRTIGAIVTSLDAFLREGAGYASFVIWLR